MQADAPTLHDRIGARLEARFATFADLARALGLTRQSFWKKLVRRPDDLRLREIRAIAAFLAVPPGWLFDADPLTREDRLGCVSGDGASTGGGDATVATHGGA